MQTLHYDPLWGSDDSTSCGFRMAGSGRTGRSRRVCLYDDYLAEANKEMVSIPVPTLRMPEPTKRSSSPVTKARRMTARTLRKAAAKIAPK